MHYPIRVALVALLLTTGAAGLAHAQYAPIPAPRYEAVPPPPPGPRAVWEPGHWHWNGGRYDWIRGHYIAYRPGYRHYVPGFWARRGGGRVWVPAHWN